MYLLQVILLHSVSAVFDLLLEVLSPVDIGKMAITMIDSLPSRDPMSQLTQAKLVLIRNIVSSELFKRNGKAENRESRQRGSKEAGILVR